MLVHGATGGAWGWQWLTPYLTDASRAVHAVTLTGLGDRVHLAHLGIDLDLHITDIVNALEFADLRDVTLVGHSYGGMIIAGVADRVPERLTQAIYLDATVPEDGQSAYDAEGGEAERVADLAAAEAAATPGFWPVPVDWFTAIPFDHFAPVTAPRETAAALLALM
jgi:pimeloyl-ACP methyl ester carboxylesterase